MQPLEFIVEGTPKSVQAVKKKAWKDKVQSAAIAALPSSAAIVATEVRVIVVFFYMKTELDLDNILKPILDAMEGVVYEDDQQIIDIIAAKRDIGLIQVLTGISPVIAGRLAASGRHSSEFVVIRVEDAESGVVP